MPEVVPPADLSPEARVIWDKLAPDLQRKHVLDAWSVEPFGRYCWLLVQAKQLRALIDRAGPVVPGRRTGEPVRHPAWTPLNQIEDKLAQLESRFGLTPADRGRVTVVTDQTDDTRDPSRYLTGGSERNRR